MPVPSKKGPVAFDVDEHVRGDGTADRLAGMKPVFAANHRWAMAQGERSLGLELARRHAAADPAILAAIPAPPGPTFPHNLRRRR